LEIFASFASSSASRRAIDSRFVASVSEASNHPRPTTKALGTNRSQNRTKEGSLNQVSPPVPPVELFTEHEVAQIFRTTLRTFRDQTRAYPFHVRIGRRRLYRIREPDRLDDRKLVAAIVRTEIGGTLIRRKLRPSLRSADRKAQNDNLVGAARKRAA
jgi:hypothetical protein